MKRNILVIDGLNVIIAQNSLPAVNAIVDHNTYPIGVTLTTLNLIKIFTDIFKPEKIIFVMDGLEAGERRRQLYPDYKNRRVIKKRVSKVEIMEGEDNIVYGVEGAYQNQIIKLFEFIKLLPITLVTIPYAEADDVIAYLALKNKEDYNTVIVSNDKDYLQLVQDGIGVYRWREKKLYSEKDFEKEHNIKAANYIFKKIMLGDTGDNVKGIKGIGEKTFKRLESILLNNQCQDIQEFLRLINSLNFDEFDTRERNSIKESLTRQNEMDLAYALMKLDESCLNKEQIELLGMLIEEQMKKTLSYFEMKIKMSKNSFNKIKKGHFNDDDWLKSFRFVKPNVKIKY